MRRFVSSVKASVLQKLQSKLLLAAENGNIAKINELLQKPQAQEIMQARNKHRCTALMLAAKAGHIEIVRVLIAACTNTNIEEIINQRDIFGNTALILAVAAGHTDIVTILLMIKGIDVNSATYFKNDSALILAAKKNHTQIVAALLAVLQINLSHTNRDGRTALMCAAKFGHFETVKILLEKPEIQLQLGQKDLYYATTLSLADISAHFNTKLISYLINLMSFEELGCATRTLLSDETKKIASEKMKAFVSTTADQLAKHAAFTGIQQGPAQIVLDYAFDEKTWNPLFNIHRNASDESDQEEDVVIKTSSLKL